MNKGLHRFTLLVACATFFLIIAGALVTSHDAGLATSDWPLSNGQVFPRMVGNLFWEHGHRMVATTVGLLTIYLWKKEERRWDRWRTDYQHGNPTSRQCVVRSSPFYRRRADHQRGNPTSRQCVVRSSPFYRRRADHQRG